jgi:hydrogenase expression/formation protein HypE
MLDTTIQLGHGSGGLLASHLVRHIVLRFFKNKTLARLEDSAVLTVSKKNIAFTTDSYVIDPIFFPGGDIGKLAICGTVNDLAVQGAQPSALSFSLIIEEGFSIADLESLLKSAARTAQRAGVEVVCGDTKVVEHGKADKIFITTSGIGVVKMKLGKENIRARDKIIISGTIGDHGVAVMNERLDLGLRFSLKSDVAPLNSLIKKLFRYGKAIRCMRDPTRGGVASVLNELISSTGYGIVLNESDIPVRNEVRGATELLGLDPLYVANEGKVIAICAPHATPAIVRTMKTHPLGTLTTVIGEVVKKPQGVWLKTSIGGTRPLLQLEAEGLPRIC